MTWTTEPGYSQRLVVVLMVSLYTLNAAALTTWLFGQSASFQGTVHALVSAVCLGVRSLPLTLPTYHFHPSLATSGSYTVDTL